VQPTSGSRRVFQAVFNASAESRFRALTASRPLAANANRWATPRKSKVSLSQVCDCVRKRKFGL
jgi:hypothetical protein